MEEVLNEDGTVIDNCTENLSNLLLYYKPIKSAAP